MSDLATHDAADVDRMLPAPVLGALGLQHVLVMYAGAVAVPLIVGGALKLPADQIAALISADLFACGVATLLQTIGLPFVGIKLPVMMGVTFASVAPMLAIGKAGGLLDIYGAVIFAGMFSFLVAPVIGRLLPLFPPIVTGSIILVIGITLMRVGIGWAAGGLPTLMVDGKPMPNPAYGDLTGLAVSAVVLLIILGITKFVSGFINNVAVLVGIVAGCIIAFALGMMHFDKVESAAWFGLVLPFQFGLPTFNLVAGLTMCLVMIVVMIESTGMFLALGEMTGKRLNADDLTRGLRADGLGTMIGGVFNTFPYTSFSQNVGLVGVTGVRSRYVAAVGGVILLALGLIPKMGALVAAVPLVVLGGAGLVMFGMVAATGIRILGGVDFKGNRNNLFIAAVSIGFGMIPLVAPSFFSKFPEALKPLLDSGILLTSIAAVALNVYYNGFKASAASAQADALAAAHAAEA